MSSCPRTKNITNYILFVLIKRRRMLAIVALSVFIFILLVASLRTPSWKATTKILVQRSSSQDLNIFNTPYNTSGSAAVASNDVLNMMILLKGENIARRIVSEFKLDERLKEQRLEPKSLRDRVQNLFANIFTNEENLTDIAVNNLIEDQQVIYIEDESNVITIEILAQTRRLAVNIANRMVEMLKERSSYFSREAARESYTLIQNQLTEALSELQRAEENVANYKVNNSIIAIEKEKIFKMARMDALETELDNAAKKIEETTSRLAQVTQEMGKLDKKVILSSIIARNPLITELESKLEGLEIDLASKRLYKTENHPEIKILRAGISKIHSTIINTIEKITKSQTETVNPLYQNLLARSVNLKIDDIALNAREKAINKALIRLNADIKSIPDREIELSRLEESRKANILIYRALNNKLGELSIKKKSITGEYGIQILDRAYLSQGAGIARPDWTLSIVVAIFFGSLIGLASVFTIEFFNDSIKSTVKINTLMNVECLGVLPDLTRLSSQEGLLIEATIIDDEF